MAGDELDKFVADILEAKQLTSITDEVRAQVLSDLKKELTDQINLALIEALPDEKIDGLNTMLDDPNVSDEAIQEYIMASGVDIRGVTARTMLFFKGLYLQTSAEREGK